MSDDELRKAAHEYSSRLYREREADPMYRDRKFYGIDVDEAFVAGAKFATPADDAAPVTPEWRDSIGLCHPWYDDTWGTDPSSPDPVGLAIQTNGRVMIRLGSTLSYLGDVRATTRGDVRRLVAALMAPPAP